MAVWTFGNCLIQLLPSLDRDVDVMIRSASRAMISWTACIRMYSLQKQDTHTQSMSVVFNMFALLWVLLLGVVFNIHDTDIDL